MLTILILARGHDIQGCLESIQELNAEVIIGDTVDAPGRVKIAGSNGAADRNLLMRHASHDWVLHLEPWERFAGKEALEWAIAQDAPAYKVYTVQGDLLTKECRLARKGTKFIRQVYEGFDAEGELIDVFLSAVSADEDVLRRLTAWKTSEPQAADIDYYIACNQLAKGNQNEFMRLSSRYLFTEPHGVSATLTHYYRSLVHINRKEWSQGVGELTYVLAEMPTFAEAWCALGDIFVRIKQYERAKIFYENAVVLGSRRLRNDSYPIHLPKYQEYPDKMINLCDIRLDDNEHSV